MKSQVTLILLLLGMNLTMGMTIAGAQTYSSYVAGTQVHASGNHWGNSNGTHHLLDTVTILVPVAVSSASWNPASQYNMPSTRSLINIYDAGLQCLIAPAGGCVPGKLYTHTGPLLSKQTNLNAGVQVAVPLADDANTVCPSYPCTLPIGTYSLTSGSSELAADTMSLWSDGSTFGSGGAEFHIGNSFGNTANEFVTAAVTGVSSTSGGGNTTVTLTTAPLGGQSSAFVAGMKVRVAGLNSGTGGPIDPPCNGLFTVSSYSAPHLVYTITGSTVTCNIDTSSANNTCGDSATQTPPLGQVACVGAGLPKTLGQLIVEQHSNQRDGYYCYQDGSECARGGFVGPAGTQTGAHSVGIMIY